MSPTLAAVSEEGGAGEDLDLGDAHSAGGAGSPGSVNSSSFRTVTPVSEITALLPSTTKLQGLSYSSTK